MYKSHEFIGYGDIDDRYIYDIKIIDSEFEETISGKTHPINMVVLDGIIQIYEKRGYTVSQIAKQIFLLFKDDMHSWIYDCKTFKPDVWDKYGKEINKFILFS